MTNDTTAKDDVPPTDVVYLNYDGNFELECDAEILQVERNEEKENDDSITIKLNKTVMHAQGGGQPTDIGTIQVKNNDAVIDISKVLIDRSTGVVAHTGTIKDSSNIPKAGDSVHVVVDPETRRTLSECHTAGHVVDSAMEKIGKTMKPTKGYHFLDGPYVEYKGAIPPEEREQTLKDLQAAYQELVNDDIATKIETLSKEEANDLCNRVALNFDMDVFCCKRTGTVRVVTVAGYPCPCGGTHVKSTMDLKSNKWGVTGIKSKKGVVRIKYGQNSY